MKYHLIAGFAILAVTVLTARFLSEKGLKELDAYQKMILTESLANYKMLSVFPPILLAVFFVFSIKIIRFTVLFSLTVCLSLLMLYLMIFYFLVFLKLVKMKISKSYIRYFILSRSISTAGFIAFFVIIIAGIL